MIPIKTPQEIEKMQTGGKILAETMRGLVSFIKPGVSELELDKLAETMILKKGGKPGFKNHQGFGYTLCVSTNDQVVHGIPTNYVFKEKDVVGLDCGVLYKGFFTDMAETVLVGGVKDPRVEGFLETGKRALENAIKVARMGNRVGHISKAIQDEIEKAGYSVVKTLIGHGLGKKLHEEPEIPGFLSGEIKDTPLLKTGMTLAIEAIYNMGKDEVVRDGKDDWTIKTKDKSLAASFEKTVAILEDKTLILTE